MRLCITEAPFIPLKKHLYDELDLTHHPKNNADQEELSVKEAVSTKLITYQAPFYRTPVNDCLLFDSYSVRPGSVPLAPLYCRLCGRRSNYRCWPGQAAQMEVPQECNNMHF
jgi:hypothetical protein